MKFHLCQFQDITFGVKGIRDSFAYLLSLASISSTAVGKTKRRQQWA
jgi:hypothetical protein